MGKLEMKYFVLNPKAKGPDDLHAKACRAAMRTYARVIRPEDEELAQAIDDWVDEEDDLALTLRRRTTSLAAP